MRLTITILLVFSSLSILAQESLGIRLSNYAPTQSVYLNPSSIADSKAFIDVNLVGVSVFARNNMVYMDADSFSMRQLIRTPETIGLPSLNTSRNRYRAYVGVQVQGPSVSVTAGKNSFALTTGARTLADVRGLPKELGEYIDEGFQNPRFHGQEVEVSNARVTALSFAEIGFTYGRIIKNSGNKMITGGVTIKRLIAGGGAGIRLNDWNFTVQDSARMTTHNINGSYAFNEPAWRSGSGWGMDIGFTIKETTEDVTGYNPHQKRTGCTTCDYKYKFSLAILDVGRIKFKPPYWNDSFTEDTEYNWDDFTETDAQDAEAISNIMVEEFNASAEATNNFRVWLPTALSAQLDYKVANHLYLNGSMILGAPWRNAYGVQRPTVIGFTPRFETKRFEFSMPLTMFEARDPMIGAMIRLNGNIVIGTDHIGTYLFNHDRYGADIYLHLKHTIFKNPACKEKSEDGSMTKRRFRLKRVKKKKGALPCHKW